MASYGSLEDCNQCDKKEVSELYSSLSESSYEQSVTLARERHKQQEHHHEDPRLRNWYHWLKVWLEDQERVRRLTRGPGAPLRALEDLVVNSGADRRQLLQDKRLMEEARYFYKPDRYRGDPSFWSPPWMLSDQGNPCLPECSAPEVKLQPRQFAGVPWASRPRPLTRSAMQRWDQLLYRAQRTQELKYELSELAPHRPDIDALYVKGFGLPMEHPRKCRSSASITATPASITAIPTEVEEDWSSLSSLEEGEREKKAAVRLLFRGELIERTSKQQQVDRPLQFLLVFEADVGRIERKNVRVENVGDTAVRFSWVRVGGAGHAAARFCLESEGGGGPAVFLPGQQYDMRIAFKACRAGIFREVWCLRTTPQLPALQLRLWGVCRAASLSVERVEHYLHRRVTEDAMRRVLLETEEHMLLEPPPPLPLSTLCTERELFQAANAGHGYTYRAEPVAELSSLYHQIAPPGAQACHLDVHHVRNTVLSLLTGQELEEALSIVYKCCKELQEPVPQRTEAAMGHSMLEAAVQAAWGLAAEAVAQEAERLRTTWGLPSKPPGFFWQPPAPMPVSNRPSTKATDKMSITSEWQHAQKLSMIRTSRHRRSGKQLSPSLSRQPSPIQESSTRMEVDPAVEDAYLVAMYVCTYHHVATAIDWTTAAIESHIVLTP